MSAVPAFFQHIGDDPELAAKLHSLFPPQSKRSLPKTRPPRSRRVSSRVPPSRVPAKPAVVVPPHQSAPRLSGRRLDASGLDLNAEIATVKAVLRRSHLCELLERIDSKQQRLVIAALIVASTHPGLLVESDVRGWPLLAWHPAIASHLNGDSPYMRERLQTFAQRLRNGWLDHTPSLSGRIDESLHPELPVGWSTGAGITGGE